MPLEAGATTIVTDCYHIFDKEALTTWMESKMECPVCKEELGSDLQII
jgi:hypothetical protein